MALRRSFAAIAAVAVLLFAAGRASADERRIATLAPEGSLWMKQMRKGASRVEKATDGRVETLYYAGGVQGDEKDVVRKMGLGHIDGAALTGIGLAMIYPGIRVLQLPGFYANVEEVDYVRKKMWPYFRKKFHKEGYELLTAGDVGWIYLFSTVKIDSEKAFKKAKIWRWDGDPMSKKLFDKLGLRGVALGVPEVLPALNTGKVEAVFGSPLAAVSLQWHNKVRYMSSAPVAYGTGGMVMRTKVWNKASEKDKKIQKKIGRKLMYKTIKLVRKDNRRALKAMKRYGVRVVKTPAGLEKQLQAESEKLWKAWVGKYYSQKELDLVIKYRDEFRDKHPDVKAQRGEKLD